jgi:hypothetical protein
MPNLAPPDVGPKRSGRDVAGSRSGAVRREAVRGLLARWRAAERELAAAIPGTDGWLRARADFDAARRAYLEVMDRTRD